jgi:hypothetical protein
MRLDQVENTYSNLKTKPHASQRKESQCKLAFFILCTIFRDMIPLIVHYVWLGKNEVPQEYLKNFNSSLHINYEFYHKIWNDNNAEELLRKYNVLDYSSTLSFISKYNLIKYLILHEQGGIYSDFDIKWKVPFTKILQQYNFNQIDFLTTIQTTGMMHVEGIQVPILDDPFFVSKKNILGSCVTFCRSRTELIFDGELYNEKGILKHHSSEPIGPFGLTQWAAKTKQKFGFFTQKEYLDEKGWYGIHAQKMTWKTEL